MAYPTDIDQASIVRVTNVNPVTGAPSLGTGDAATSASTPVEGILGYNGTTWDRLRTASATGAALGTVGGLAVPMHLWDNTAATYRPIYSAGSLGDANPLTLAPATSLFAYNGTTFDRTRSNMDASLLASAARTANTPSADQTNYNARGVVIVLDMSVVGTGSVTISIQGKDSVSGNYYTLLAGAAVTTNSTNVYTIYPGNTVAVNVSASTVIPRTWRVNVIANNANSATYSVSASVIL